MSSINDRPLVSLDAEGKPAVLSYDLPDTTVQGGINFIELKLAAGYFSNSGKPNKNETAIDSADEAALIARTVLEADAIAIPKREMLLDLRKGVLRQNSPKRASVNSTPADASPERLTREMLMAKKLTRGHALKRKKSFSGKERIEAVAIEPLKTPRLALLEVYRLSTFLGNYGAGKAIKTFSLLPGEELKINIRSFKASEEKRREAASILDSVETSIADEFGQTLENEQSVRANAEESFEYQAEATADATWGWGNATVSGSLAGTTNASREEFGRNMQSAVSKHAATASSKREVTINSESEARFNEEEETAIERKVKNINVGRALNFVFRQLNQEFVSILHLIDIKLAYHEGSPDTYEEFALHELDTFLERKVVAGKRAGLKKAILNELRNVMDYRGEIHDVTSAVPLRTADGKPSNTKSYLRLKQIISTYRDPVQNGPSEQARAYRVEGVIVKAFTSVMRTDGVIVEALLSGSDALDRYSEGLQNEDVRTRQLSNGLTEQELERRRLVLEIVRNRDSAQAELFERIAKTECAVSTTTAELEG